MSWVSLEILLGPSVRKYETKLSIWKTNYLSLGERITLIKAALANLLIYFTSLLKCPARVLKCVEKMQRHFLWQGSEKKKKIPLVKWSLMCKSKVEGGLGIRFFKEVNEALLAKWLSRLGDGSISLWKQVLFSKYNISRDGWIVREAAPCHSGSWKGILSVKGFL